MEKLKVALVLGATGLVGEELTKQLLLDESYGKIVVISRRPLQLNHPKIQVLLVDFEDLNEHALDLQGDVLFSCLGTTLKIAKSKEAQYKVDYTYQYNIAKICAENGVEHYVLISSLGAHSKSTVFYSKMKGELEEAIQKLPFTFISILQPSVLDGKRKEFRLGEKIGIIVMKMIGFLPFLNKYRVANVKKVAKCMINCVKNKQTGIIHNYFITK
jgi:uncharacterized protein YbjT (DUF2867 family)